MLLATEVFPAQTFFYKAVHSSPTLPREVSLEGSEAEHPHVQEQKLSVPEKPVLREGGSVCVCLSPSAGQKWHCLSLETLAVL